MPVDGLWPPPRTVWAVESPKVRLAAVEASWEPPVKWSVGVEARAVGGKGAAAGVVGAEEEVDGLGGVEVVPRHAVAVIFDNAPLAGVFGGDLIPVGREIGVVALVDVAEEVGLGVEWKNGGDTNTKASIEKKRTKGLHHEAVLWVEGYRLRIPVRGFRVQGRFHSI